MILLDTTVLVYAVGGDHPLREPCYRLIRAVAEGSVGATTTAEAIQEFAHVRARRRSREDAAAYALDFAELLAPLPPVTHEALRFGLRIFADHDSIGAFDAVLIAVASAEAAIDAVVSAEAAIDAVVSADRGFTTLPGVRHVFPDDAGVDSLFV